MKFYQVKIMVPLSYTVQAETVKKAETLARKLTHGKAQVKDLAPFLHSVVELKEDGPHGQPHTAA